MSRLWRFNNMSVDLRAVAVLSAKSLPHQKAETVTVTFVLGGSASTVVYEDLPTDLAVALFKAFNDDVESRGAS